MKKLLILFLVIILTILAYFGWLRYKEIFSQSKNGESSLINYTAEESAPEKNNSEIIPSPDDQFPAVIREPEPGGFQDISTSDCENECQAFLVENELTYCQEVCGLKTPENKEQTCETLKNLGRDYCFKNQAVAKKDFGLCEKISDPNIRKTCQNRVTEDIFDQ